MKITHLKLITCLLTALALSNVSYAGSNNDPFDSTRYDKNSHMFALLERYSGIAEQIGMTTEQYVDALNKIGKYERKEVSNQLPALNSLPEVIDYMSYVNNGVEPPREVKLAFTNRMNLHYAAMANEIGIDVKFMRDVIRYSPGNISSMRFNDKLSVKLAAKPTLRTNSDLDIERITVVCTDACQAGSTGNYNTAFIGVAIQQISYDAGASSGSKVNVRFTTTRDNGKTGVEVWKYNSDTSPASFLYKEVRCEGCMVDDF